MHQYYDQEITERSGNFLTIFQNSQKNSLITFSNPKTNSIFCTVGTKHILDYDLLGGTQAIPIWRHSDDGTKSNVTEYGLNLFRRHYMNKKITGDDIFYYTYAIFNDPKYEAKYRANLQKNHPRIPLAQNFEAWSSIGRRLFEMHSNFSSVERYGLKRVDKHAKRNKTQLKLKMDHTKGGASAKLVIDDSTTLEGVPSEALEYVIGVKTPLERILEYYGESKNRIGKESSEDEDVRNRFSAYRFSDHKERVIELLDRVTRICVDTTRMRKKIELMEWGPQPNLKFTKISKVKKSKRSRRSKSTGRIKIKNRSGENIKNFTKA